MPLSASVENPEASLEGEENACSLPTAFPDATAAPAEGPGITKPFCFVLAPKGLDTQSY